MHEFIGVAREPAVRMAARWAGPLARVHLLTVREREVFASLGVGAENSRIARELGISLRTAKHHLTSIMLKLDVRSRLEAGIVACLYELGWHQSPVLARVSNCEADLGQKVPAQEETT